jgi:hypothetical protein
VTGGNGLGDFAAAAAQVFFDILRIEVLDVARKVGFAGTNAPTPRGAQAQSLG